MYEEREQYQERIVRLRHRVGLSQTKFAKAIGVGQRSQCRYENSRIAKHVPLRYFLTIQENLDCAAFNTGPFHLMFGVSSKLRIEPYQMNERLAEERVKSNLGSQKRFARLAGASQSAQSRYERDSKFLLEVAPEYFFRLDDLGLDVIYILTGKRENFKREII